MNEPINLVWLKRDLRWDDHEALAAAFASAYRSIVFFCFENSIQKSKDFGLRHWQAQYHSILEMNQTIAPFGHQVLMVQGSVEDFLLACLKHCEVAALYSHQEHGIQLTFKRDKAVKKLLDAHQVPWHEYEHNGVQRARRDRRGWDEAWRDYMQRNLSQSFPTKEALYPWNEQEDLKELLASFRLKAELEEKLKDWPSAFVAIGAQAAQARLQNFLGGAINGYQKHIGEPKASQLHCSRLSVALAWGNLSLRQVYQSARDSYANGQAKGDHRAFISRLHWHSHFIQKFEMEVRMEKENLNRAYDKVRQDFKPSYLEAWRDGLTGFPLVDACMRAVQETGYLNFRMRAMVVSFWSHLLWQPWQEAHYVLAQRFLDYVPGIHIPQFQMQSSTTGINTIRIYNPIKQSLEKDAEGEFIRQWLPELAHLPTTFLHQPWLLSPLEEQFYNFKLGRDYPHPMVDFKQAHEKARDTLWKMKKDPLVQRENQRILQKHTTSDRNIERRTRTILSTNRSISHD